MFDFDEEQAKPKKKNLQEMSIFELEEYIENMQKRIEEVKQLIKSKKAASDAASAFFKK